MDMRHLEATDPEIAAIIRREEHRQFEGIELIASENYVSTAVAETMANIMTNKYAEGLPGKRYYGGFGGLDEGERAGDRGAQPNFRTGPAHPQPPPGPPGERAAYLPPAKPAGT